MATNTTGTHVVDPEKETAENYPKEIASNLKTFQKSLQDVETILEPLVTSSMPAIHSQVGFK